MRRRMLCLGGLAGAGLMLTGWPRMVRAQIDAADITEVDRVLGDPEAPVTLIEYASFTCGHCADFHNQTLPPLKAEYIDTGRVKLVFRDFPLDQWALRAGMMARCAPEAQYFAIVDALFASQRQWISAEDPLRALAQIGRIAGIGPDQFAACMEDEALAQQIVDLRQQGQDRFEVRSTPTFVLDGEVFSGNRDIELFREKFDAALS